MIKKIITVLACTCFFSCEDIIAVEDISEEIITILAPSNNIVLESSSVNFSWQPIEFADSYQLQIAIPDFEASQQIVADTIISTSNFSKVLETNTYQWRVKAINFGYETQFTTQNLTVED